MNNYFIWITNATNPYSIGTSLNTPYNSKKIKKISLFSEKSKEIQIFKVKQAIGVKNKMLNIIHFWRNFKRNSMKNNLEDNGKCLKLFQASLKHEMQINVEAITIKCKEVSNQSKRHWITSLGRIRTYKPKRSATPIS